MYIIVYVRRYVGAQCREFERCTRTAACTCRHRRRSSSSSPPPSPRRVHTIDSPVLSSPAHTDKTTARIRLRRHDRLSPIYGPRLRQTLFPLSTPSSTSVVFDFCEINYYLEPDRRRRDASRRDTQPDPVRSTCCIMYILKWMACVCARECLRRA